MNTTLNCLLQNSRSPLYEFDLIIYATGFDAIVGSYNRIDVKGVDGQTLRDQWEKQLKTFLGLQVSNFPNMFMVMGPHALLGNNPRSLEYNAEWINDLLSYMKKHNFGNYIYAKKIIKTKKELE